VSAHPSPLVITSFYNEISGGHIGSCRFSKEGLCRPSTAPVPLPVLNKRASTPHRRNVYLRRYTIHTFDLWPLTLKTFWAIATQLLNICVKFRLRPSTAYIASREIDANGQRTAVRKTRKPNASADYCWRRRHKTVRGGSGREHGCPQAWARGGICPLWKCCKVFEMAFETCFTVVKIWNNLGWQVAPTPPLRMLWNDASLNGWSVCFAEWTRGGRCVLHVRECSSRSRCCTAGNSRNLLLGVLAACCLLRYSLVFAQPCWRPPSTLDSDAGSVPDRNKCLSFDWTC